MAEMLSPTGTAAEIIARIDAQHSIGRSGIDGGTAFRWIREAVDELDIPAMSAQSPSPDGLGDVRANMVDGGYVWIEVKAQTTKPFRELIQADWVRDDTDAVRWLAINDARLRRLLSTWTAQQLDVVDPASYFGNWDFAHLWLADIALLPNRLRRRAAGISTFDDLHRFMKLKYLFHFSNEGLRVARLDMLVPVQEVMRGSDVHVSVAALTGSEARAWVATPNEPGSGSIDFVYYIGYPQHEAIGRHKLTNHAVEGAGDLLVIT